MQLNALLIDDNVLDFKINADCWMDRAAKGLLVALDEAVHEGRLADATVANDDQLKL